MREWGRLLAGGKSELRKGGGWWEWKRLFLRHTQLGDLPGLEGQRRDRRMFEQRILKYVQLDIFEKQLYDYWGIYTKLIN